jgi:hypothetical protein
MPERERRKCIRFELPRATLSYKLKNDPSLQDLYLEEFCPISEISRGGICFLSKIIPKLDSYIELKITIPGEPVPLSLKGIVQRIGMYSGMNYSGQIGVQFNPFGDENPEQNYPDILAKIIALEEKFAPPKAKEPE